MRISRRSMASIFAVMVLTGPSVGDLTAQDRAHLPAKKAAAPPSTVMGWIGPVSYVAGQPNLSRNGWAADARTGAPVARVEILFNDKVVGRAELGEARRDVVQTLRRPDFLKSGWKARVELKGMRSGTYRLTARAWNARGESALLNTGPVDIKVP